MLPIHETQSAEIGLPSSTCSIRWFRHLDKNRVIDKKTPLPTDSNSKTSHHARRSSRGETSLLNSFGDSSKRPAGRGRPFHVVTQSDE